MSAIGIEPYISQQQIGRNAFIRNQLFPTEEESNPLLLGLHPSVLSNELSVADNGETRTPKSFRKTD